MKNKKEGNMEEKEYVEKELSKLMESTLNMENELYSLLTQ